MMQLDTEAPTDIDLFIDYYARFGSDGTLPFIEQKWIEIRKFHGRRYKDRRPIVCLY